MKTILTILFVLGISSAMLAISNNNILESNIALAATSGGTPDITTTNGNFGNIHPKYSTLPLKTTKSDSLQKQSEVSDTNSTVFFPNFLEIFFQFDYYLNPTKNTNHEH